MKLLNTTTYAIILSTSLFLSGCGEGEDTITKTPAEIDPALATVFVESLPVTEEPQSIHVARVDAESGDSLVLKGQIIGAEEPFIDGRAAFIIGDRELLTPCNEMEGDSCKTPWDACCDPTEKKVKGIATIQLVGENGEVIRSGVEGVGGLEKLAHIQVAGEVSEQSGNNHLVINAKQIKVVKNEE